MRNLLFVSHANPEDNIFSRWLALQLAKEGYGVWCDQTRLLGGEDFWADIEEVIRKHACKLLYDLSASSNHEPGPLQELHVAQTVARREGWRDRTLGLMDWLSHGQEVLRLRFGSECEIAVSALPEVFSSPVSYEDPEVKPTPPPEAIDVDETDTSEEELDA
jgi:hypothetical protein